MYKLLIKPDQNCRVAKPILLLTAILFLLFGLVAVNITQHLKEKSQPQINFFQLETQPNIRTLPSFLPPRTQYFKQHKFNINEINNRLYSDRFLFKHRIFMKELVKYCDTNPLDSTIAQKNCSTAYKVNSNIFFLRKGAALIISELPKETQLHIILGFIGFILLFIPIIRVKYFITVGLVFIISQLYF